MARSSRRFFALFAAATLAGCGSGALTLPAGNATDGGTLLSGAAKVPVTIRIVVPKRRHQRSSRFVSPSTKGMTIALTGPSTVHETVGLTPASPGCSRKDGVTVCEFVFRLAPCPPKKNCYSGALTAYDAVACAPACTIPTGAHALSADQAVSFSVKRGKRNAVHLALDGIPASLAVVAGAGSTLSGNWSTGFTISKCVTARQNVSVVGYDADKNQIVGPGEPSASLASDDKTHLAVATPAPSAAPNAFALVPPATLTAGATIPNAHGVVHLTAVVEPLRGAGSPVVVTAHVNVTFNADVCGIVSEFAIPSKGGPDNLSIPEVIAVGPDGNLWFAETCTDKIGKITTNGAITEYSGMTAHAYPFGVVAGPGGKMWFTEHGTHKIGTITTDGTITEYSSAMLNGPFNAVVGANGLVWFTDDNNNSVGTITTDGGSVEEYTVTTTNSAPAGITAGGDGNLWFTEAGKDKIGKSTTNGSVTEFSSGITASSAPETITAGPDGALWFTEADVTNVGRVTTDGTVHEYPVSGASGQLTGITTGPDGALWFTENSNATGKIWRITTGGTITKYSGGLIAFRDPNRIATGPDGALWFTEALGWIARMQ